MAKMLRLGRGEPPEIVLRRFELELLPRRLGLNPITINDGNPLETVRSMNVDGTRAGSGSRATVLI